MHNRWFGATRLALFGAVSALVLGFGTAAAAQAAPAAPPDSLKIVVGGTTVVNFIAANETQQFFSALQVAAFPQNFVAGTLYFTEPAGETGSEITSLGGQDVSSMHVSDALSINGSAVTGKFNVFFISDGASANDLANFPIFATVNTTKEVAGPMDVSRFFGFPANSIVVTSDVVPEPASWLMMILGFCGLGAVMRHAKAARRAEGAIA